MTFPMWFAVPPEVPSAWLSTGMGPGPLLAAARAWHALAAQYTEIATELASVLAAVQASSWQGPSADRFVVAHQPFRYWLTHAATVATAAAAAHETAAAGYTSALGGMPTLAELAANHAMHGALVTTNFFGVNTIPIALNEADYLRMWIQAATVMSHYQAVAHESVAATPSTPPAPQIVTSAASSAASSSFPDPTKLILQLLKDFLELLRYLAVELLPGPLGDLIAQVLDCHLVRVRSSLHVSRLPGAGPTDLFRTVRPADESGPVACRADRACRARCGIGAGRTNGRTCALRWSQPAKLACGHRSHPGGYQPGCPGYHARTRSDHVRGTDGTVDSRIQPPKAFTRSVVPTGKGSTRSPRRQHSPVLPPMPPHLPPNCPATKLRAAPAKQQDCGDVSGNTASSFWPTTAA